MVFKARKNSEQIKESPKQGLEVGRGGRREGPALQGEVTGADSRCGHPHVCACVFAQHQ